MTAEQCLSEPYVDTSIRVLALKLSKKLPASMDFEDARQELIAGLLGKLSEFDSTRSSIKTFAYVVLRSITHGMLSTKKLYIYEQTTDISSAMVEDTTRPTELRVIDSITCDLIESKLEGKAKDIFCLLRRGQSRISAARIIHVHRSYVTRLLQKKIWKVVNKCVTV